MGNFLIPRRKLLRLMVLPLLSVKYTNNVFFKYFVRNRTFFLRESKGGVMSHITVLDCLKVGKIISRVLHSPKTNISSSISVIY